MKVLVLGAGAIGSLYAAKLSGTNDVTVLARQEHADAINRDGLRLVGRESSTHRVRAVTTVDRVPSETLVLLTTKVNDNRAVTNALRGRIDANVIILCIQNGLGGEDIVKEVLGRPQSPLVLRAVTQFGAIFKEPGVIDYKVAGYTLVEDSARSRCDRWRSRPSKPWAPSSGRPRSALRS